MESLYEEDAFSEEADDECPGHPGHDNSQDSSPAQWKNLRESCNLAIGSQFQPTKNPDAGEFDDGGNVGKNAAKKLDLMIRSGQIEPGSGIFVNIPALESPSNREKIGKSPMPSLSPMPSVSQTASTSVSRKLSLMHQPVSQNRPGSRRLSVHATTSVASPGPSRRTSTMSVVNLSGHLLRVERSDQTLNSSRRTSVAQPHSANASRRNSHINLATSDRKGSILDITEVARRAQQRGIADRTQPPPSPSGMSLGLQLTATDDSSSSEEEDTIAFQEGDELDMLDSVNEQGQNTMLSDVRKPRKSMMPSPLGSPTSGEKRTTVKSHKHKRKKGDASKEIVNTAVDARAMAIRQAALIKQWIQDAADDASKCHEKYLNRRRKLREDHHRASLSIKSEERIESDTRKIAHRLRRKRKTGIATRLLGASSPRSSYLCAASPRGSFNKAQTSPAHAQTSNDPVVGRNVGAQSLVSTTPSADISSTLSTPSDDVSRSLSDFKKSVLATSTTPDGELAFENSSKLMSRPHSTPSTQTGGLRSASSSSAGLRAGVSPFRLCNDFNSGSPIAASVEWGSPFKPELSNDDVLPSGFISIPFIPSDIGNAPSSRCSDGESSDDSPRDVEASNVTIAMNLPKSQGLTLDALESAEQSSRPTVQRRSTTAFVGKTKAILNRGEVVKFSPDVPRELDSDSDVASVDGLQMISELEVSHVMARARRSLPPSRSLPPIYGDSEDNTDVVSSRSYNPEKLPEVPRLRAKYRDYRLILRDQWRNEACTVKRFHLQYAEQLGLVEEDWSWMGCIYSVSVSDFEYAAEIKAEKERVDAALKVQAKWRAWLLYRLTMKLCRDRLQSRVTIQRWWRHHLKFRAPMRRRINGRPAFMRAMLRVQAFARGRVVRHHVELRKQLHSVSWRMQCLKESLGGYEIETVLRIQSFVRGFLARRRVQLLRNQLSIAKQAALEEVATKAATERSRRMSFIRLPMQNIGRGQEIMRMRGRRASEVISMRPMTFKNDLSLASFFAQRAEQVQEDRSRDANSSSSDSETDSQSGLSSSPCMTPLPQTAGSRVTTSTPLGRRLKRPLDSEVARMGGLHKHYGNIAEMVRRQPKKKLTRTKLGSFVLQTVKRPMQTKQKDNIDQKADTVSKITIPIPGKKRLLKPIQVQSRTTTSRRCRKNTGLPISSTLWPNSTPGQVEIASCPQAAC